MAAPGLRTMIAAYRQGRDAVTAALPALILAAALLFPAFADGVDDGPVTPAPYLVEISKSERVLRIKHANETFRQFPVSWGRGGPGDKQKYGDNRTPVGIYRIAGFNDSSKFHLFMRLNYPNVKDAFYGLKNGVITRYEFERIVDSLKHGELPPQNTGLGGSIGIHGVGIETDEKLKIHSKVNWTEGCIALTNNDIAELRHYVSVGTEVVIKE